MVTVFEPLFGNFVTMENEASVAKCMAEMNTTMYKEGCLRFNDYYDILSNYDESGYLRNNPRPLAVFMYGQYEGFVRAIADDVFSYGEDTVCGNKCYVIRYPLIGIRY